MDAIDAGARRICETLCDAGFRALLAGGCVRDIVRGEMPADYDIATSARPDQVTQLFPRTAEVGAAFGVVLVMIDDTKYEVATFRKDGPYLDGRHPQSVEFADEKEDALRRDFTINALFLDPESCEVLDYVNGRDDIQAGVVRAVGDPRARFREDRLRMLRACRFAARFDYAIAADTRDAILENAAAIDDVSPERCRDELVKMLTGARPHVAMNLMDECGLLAQVLPEIDAMKGVEQPPQYHPEGDVYVHTLLALEQLRAPTAALALGLLLHDVGKPVTQTFEDRIRFNNHDSIGAEMAEAICTRFRCSNELTDRVVWLVQQHMRIAVAPDMRAAKLKRLVREPGFDELLELHRCDCAASHGNLETYEWLRDYAASLDEQEVQPEPLIRGEDLIRLGFTPGPIFAEILEAVEDAQLEGELTNSDEAERFVRDNWK